MKYSILMPYYKRSEYLHNTLLSFQYHYGDRDDYEVVIVEDRKNNEDEDENKKLREVVQSFSDVPVIILGNGVYTLNPCISYNIAASFAHSPYFLITNPECYHITNILEQLDKEIENDDDKYIACSCLNANTAKMTVFDPNAFQPLIWYQHSEYNNRQFHFCSYISARNYFRIGGFDEIYKDGIAYDDNDFITSVRYHKIPVFSRDEMQTIHQNHNTDVIRKRPDLFELDQKNKKLYEAKWKNLLGK